MMMRSARTIQMAARRFIHKKRVEKLSRSVLCLQTAFRGRWVRRWRPKAVVAAARRIARVNKNADPRSRLGNQTRLALKILQTSKSLSEIMHAVKLLEVSTRLSVVCCETFANAGAATILLRFIVGCNRSLPHVELVHCILLVLDNVARHKAFVASFATTLSAEVFLDKLQMYRDKEVIFCLTVSLLNEITRCNPAVMVSHFEYVYFFFFQTKWYLDTWNSHYSIL